MPSTASFASYCQSAFSSAIDSADSADRDLGCRFDTPGRSKPSPVRPAGAADRSGGYRRDHLRAWPSELKWDAKEVASWVEKRAGARWSLPQAQQRRILACSVLYRNGALGEIELPTSESKSDLYPAELRRVRLPITDWPGRASSGMSVAGSRRAVWPYRQPRSGGRGGGGTVVIA